MANCQDCIHYKVCYVVDQMTDLQEYKTAQDLKDDCEACILTADVVPKSERMMCGEKTGKVIVQLQEQIAELNKRQFPSYCQAFSEEEAINIGREYGKTEVAREIFEQVDGITDLLAKGLIGELEFYDMLAELKKKYTEE